MRWPWSWPSLLADGLVNVSAYVGQDRDELFAALVDPLAWEHIPRQVPATAGELDQMIRAKLGDGSRVTFTIRAGGRVVGTTSVLYDAARPNGVEIGGTQLDPTVWGTGINATVKRLLLDQVFSHGAEWVLFRTDERNMRSAAALAKLGARDLGIHQDTRVRRDGSVRRSRLFRLDAPIRAQP